MAARLRLLGRARIFDGHRWLEAPYDKRLGLLAYLAYAGDWVRREKLATLFWSEHEEARARHDLRHLIYRTKALGFAADLEIRPDSLRWSVDTDVQNFFRAAARQDWAAAVALYGGELLHGLQLGSSPEFTSWLELEREHLRALRRDVVIGRAAELESSSRYPEAAALLKTLVEDDEFDENALRLYLRDAVLGGRREEALETYGRFTEKLREELGLEPLPATRELVDALRGGHPSTQSARERSERPAKGVGSARTASERLRNFPSETTPFIGRDVELAEIADLLSQPSCTLLTLVGPGGIGKTRLAQKAAIEAAGSYADGATFVPLAPLATATLLASAIANSLSLSFYGQGEPELQLVAFLRDKEMLLLLDNLEHLPGAPPLISGLLEGCPGIKILATSRERLHLAREWRFQVGGMSLPLGKADAWAEGFDAVQLFLRHARRAGTDIALDGDNRATIVRICQLVGGAPLGIELAAGWTGILSCRELAEEMAKGFDFLASPLHDVPERHRGLRQVFEHSWRLLTETERTAFKRLSVFVGGFTREAAEAVTGISLRLLLSLLGKSLIQRSSDGRFDLHELVKRYAAEKLRESPDEERSVRDRYAAFYAAFLHERDRRLRGGEQQHVALQEVGTEIDNIRSAWEWAVRQRDTEALEHASSGLRFFCQTRGYYQEGEEAFRLAADAFTAESVTYGTLLLFRGLFTWWLGRYDAAQEIAERSLGILVRQQAPPEKLANANFLLGLVCRALGESERANHQFGKALVLARRGGDAFFEARALHFMGLIAESRGAFDRAERRYRQGIAVYTRAGERYGLARGLIDLGSLLETRGHLEAARRHYLEGLEAARAVGSRLRTAQALIRLGALGHREGLYAQARSDYGECLALVRERNEQPFRSAAAQCLIGLGEAACALARPREAFGYLSDAVEVALEADDLPSATRGLVALADLLRDSGGEETVLTLLVFVLEQPRLDERSRESARRLYLRLAARLSDPVLSSARERGRSLDVGGIAAVLGDLRQRIES